MDQVYSMLTKEQNRLKERKQTMELYTNTAVPQLLSTLASIRKENEELRV